MAEYSVDIDEAHELMLDQMIADDADRDEVLSNLLEQSIYNTYQQSKQNA